MPLELPDQIEKFKEFFEVNENYHNDLLQQVRKGNAWVNLEFADLARHSPELADMMLDNPDDILKACQIAIEKMDLPRSSDEAPLRVEPRMFHLPPEQNMAIRVIRSKHLNRFIEIIGIVRQKSDVRPQMTSAKFECPSCGNIIPVLQLDQKFQEPTRCGCGRKGKFKLLSKELVDAQGITLEEAPEELEGGEQPKRLKLFLKNDLVAPFNDKRTNPGAKIRVVGSVKEVPIVLQTGGQSTRFDLILDVNSIEAVQEDFTEISISEEDEVAIHELSQDPDVLEKLVSSIAPSIYGHDSIKQALLLQMFGGVHKARDKGVKSRGDIHILLIGDPGSGKCVTGDTLVQLSDGSIQPIADIVDTHKGEQKNGIAYATCHPVSTLCVDEYGLVAHRSIATLWKRKERESLLRITLMSGERITVTKDHPFFTTQDALVYGIPAHELRRDMPIACPRHIAAMTASQPIVTWRRSVAHNKISIRVPASITKDLSRLIGYLAGDGWIDRRLMAQRQSMLSFTNNDPEVIDDYETILRSLHVPCTRRAAHKGKSTTEIYSCASELHSLITTIAPEIASGAGEKSVPQAIMRSPNEILAEFIRGLFECDAHNNPAKRSIEYSTKSLLMAREIKMLLLRFGIQSRLYTKQKRATNSKTQQKTVYHEVVISGEDVDRYISSIGFVSAKKRSVQHTTKKNTNKDTLPGIAGLLRTVRKNSGKTIREMALPLGSYRHYEKGDREPSVSQMKALLNQNAMDNDPLMKRLRQFVNADIFWDRVKTIEELPPQETDVYDFEVEKTHNFIANSIVVHNSQMLKRISNIAPKARFISGKGASGAGLTASVVKDEFLKGWALEAGALVLANKGIACIDELDKMTKEDTSAMHEALEQQTVTINKANIQATLRCETTVLAAANPKFGRFDPYEIISKQIELPPTLLNRFDLIFPVRDMPDKTKDEKLASFILSLHKEEGGQEGLIKPDLIKKYVAFARQRCFPKLTEPAMVEIRDYYVKMRGGGEGNETAIKAIPISARQLEALVRLSEASARMRLSEKVTKRDAQVAIELIHYCLHQIGMDPDTGKIDIDRITTGITASQRSHISVIKELIQEMEATVGKAIPIDDLIREASIKGIAEDTTSEVVEKLKRAGDIYSPKHGFVSRL